jgi:hypothetical protein
MGVSIEVYFILLILGVPNFFLWRWLLKKKIKVEETRKMATWTATILTTPLIYIGLVTLWLYSMNYYPTNDFDREKWFANEEKRYELSEDLIESKMLIGKTKLQVRKLLGDEGNFDESDNWNYYLGLKPGLFSIDPDMFEIIFKNGKVILVRQRET